MTDKDRKDAKAPAPANKRRPLSPQALAQRIEAQRQHLAHVQAIVRSAVRLLIESYDFEIGEAHLGFCGEAIIDLLGRAITALEPLSIPPTPERAPADPMTLAVAIEAPRQQVFRAQAVAQAVATLLPSHTVEQGEAALRITFEGVVQMLEQAITALEPLSFGLPIPR